MIYSCFNEQLGLYEYFESTERHAVNGDLPVPELNGLMAGRVGVPARDAGRTMPSSAKRVGTGLMARGVIVNCDNLPTPALSLAGAAQTSADLQTSLLWMGAGAAAGYLVEHYREGRPIFGSIFGGLVAGVAYRVVG